MISTSLTGVQPWRDRLRQALNVVLSIAQIGVTILGYVIGVNKNFDSTNGQTPQVVPANYAFSIWGLIYAGSLAYAIYQALPGQRENPLLRKVGFYTASAFLATTCWLVVAQNNLEWLTVICLFWILGSLLGAFCQFIDRGDKLSWTERWLVVAPISVYLGWATVAAIANTASALQDSGFRSILFPNQIWAALMILIGGGIASFVVYRSHGNVPYAFTILWALIGLIVANIIRTPSPLVASIAGAMAALVTLVLWLSRRAGRAAF